MGTKVCVLGSTGSIGRQTLDVISEHPEEFTVVALGARASVDLLEEQVRRFKPLVVAVSDEEAALELARRLKGHGTEVLDGAGGLEAAAALPEADVVVAAIVGIAGLRPTMAAVRAGKRVALANKESLVAAGELVTHLVAESGARIIPVDSEHSAVFQCLEGVPDRGLVTRILLTASGGPFRGWDRSALQEVTPELALRHPTWDMGPKITIDSATLMNKGLEVIEAHWLFGLDYGRIGVLIHPESVVHSMVELADGAVLAQLGVPDMRLPIAYALSYPGRLELGVPRLDLLCIGRLAFEAPDTGSFPCLKYAYEAGKIGGTMPAVLNAANEEAVTLFLEGRIRFLEIAECIRAVMDLHEPVEADCLEAILEADRWARMEVRRRLG